jgi:hypothetical protein
MEGKVLNLKTMDLKKPSQQI